MIRTCGNSARRADARHGSSPRLQIVTHLHLPTASKGAVFFFATHLLGPLYNVLIVQTSVRVSFKSLGTEPRDAFIAALREMRDEGIIAQKGAGNST